jgi:hypothetical protein
MRLDEHGVPGRSDAGRDLPGVLGRNLHSFYLTWSPYHHAAQAYGLAVVYAYRSGCLLGARDKKLLGWVSMLPFLTCS